MRELNLNQMSNLNGGNLSTACGFAVGVGTVAALTTSPIAPATWGFIATGVVAFCGTAILKKVPAFR